MILKQPKQYLYLRKGAGLGSAVRSIFSPIAFKSRIKTVGRNILAKGKTIINDILKPALKVTGKAALDVLKEQVRQKAPNISTSIQDSILRLANKTQKQPLISAAQLAAPLINKASRDILNRLVSGSGLKYIN